MGHRHQTETPPIDDECSLIAVTTIGHEPRLSSDGLVSDTAHGVERLLTESHDHRGTSLDQLATE